MSGTIVTLNAIAIGVAKILASNQIPAMVILAVDLLGVALLITGMYVLSTSLQEKVYSGFTNHVSLASNEREQHDNFSSFRVSR